MLPNSGWRADFSIPMETAPLRETRRNQFMLELNIVFGRNGELQLVTGQGEVLLETCGTRVPELDKDYRDQIPLDQRFEWAYEIEDGPPPATNCPDPEE